MSTIAENTRRIIENKGLKHKAVAKKAGYTAQVFSNMLNDRKLITGIDIVKISVALDVTPNELLGYPSNKEGEQ